MTPTPRDEALRALAEKVAGLRGASMDRLFNMLDDLIDEADAALATAQPEAKPGGVEDWAIASAERWVRDHGQSIIPPEVEEALLEALAAYDPAKVGAVTVRQAQATDGKIIAALHAEIARLRRLLGGRAYKTPVSGHNPADVSTESANVDMRQARGGGEDSNGTR